MLIMSLFYARNGNRDKTKHSKDKTPQPDDKSATQKPTVF